MTNAEEIAFKVYPKEWKEIKGTGLNGFKIDNNAGKRECAKDIAQHFLEVLRDEKTIRGVMKAFYRREHGCEPDKSEVAILTAQMGTALLVYELQLKAIKPGA